MEVRGHRRAWNSPRLPDLLAEVFVCGVVRPADDLRTVVGHLGDLKAVRMVRPHRHPADGEAEGPRHRLGLVVDETQARPNELDIADKERHARLLRVYAASDTPTRLPAAPGVSLVCEMTATRAGLWLIGIGSLVTVVAAVAGAPRAVVGGLRFAGPYTSTRERLAFAGEAAGLGHVAAGAAVVGIAELPAWWFAAMVAATVIASVWLVAAWKQWEFRIDHRQKALVPGNDEAERAWRQRSLDRCASWRWCLLHPLEDEAWPRNS